MATKAPETSRYQSEPRLPRSAVAALAAEGATTATVGFRPESVAFVGPGEGFPAEVLVVEETGSDAYAYGRLHIGGRTADLPDAAETPLTLRADPRKPPATGEIVHVAIRPEEVHVFSAASGLRISEVEN